MLFIRKISLILFILAVLWGGCAMYQGPHQGSTASPPVPPPKPPPLAPVFYEHTLKENSQTLPIVETSTFQSAYSKRGKPLVTCVFFTSERSIIVGQSTAPLYHAHTSVSVEGERKDSKKGSTSVKIEGTASTASAVTTGWPPSRAQLVTWSDIQQVAFETLKSFGVRVADPEMTTLKKLDNLINRFEQDVAVQTAELESLREASGSDVLLLIQSIADGNSLNLQGRLWDLKTGELLAAKRIPIMSFGSEWLQKELTANKTRQLIQDLLSQAATSWG